jgi:hypothetical protein
MTWVSQFHIINVQRRMADWSFEKAHTWEDLLAAHEKWMNDYNFQRIWPMRSGMTDVTALRLCSGGSKACSQSRICETRTLTKAGYARFRNFLLYGEQGLVGNKTLVNIFQDVLTLEYGEHPLSRYSVE